MSQETNKISCDAMALVLIEANEAQAIMERNNLSIKEMKEAQKLFKKAAKSLGAAITLLEEGCTRVTNSEYQA